MKSDRVKMSLGRLVIAVALFCAAFAPAGHAAQAVSGEINITTAQADEFALLPGIGPKKAEAIVAYRAEHPFQKLEELIEVKGIGPKMFEAIKPYLKLDGESTLHVGTAAPTPVTAVAPTHS